jgi:hypothetical protein
MTGTFAHSDRLKIQKCSLKCLMPGDVIVFSQLNNSIKTDLVHRIMRRSMDSLVTRGDNNPKNDDEPVLEANLLGKVTHYERNGKAHRVWNGRLGMLRARFLHGKLNVIRILKFLLKKPYRTVKKWGVLQRLWQPEIETLHFETQEGPLVKYVHKGRTVACCWTASNRWWFKRPYDFILDPRIKKQEKRNSD